MLWQEVVGFRIYSGRELMGSADGFESGSEGKGRTTSDDSMGDMGIKVNRGGL